MPSDSGVTSSSSRSLVACRAAGQNLGLHRRAQRHHFVGIQFGVRLLAAREQLPRTSARTGGMRVDPPTSTTSSICSGCQVGVLHRLPARAEPCVQNRLRSTARTARA